MKRKLSKRPKTIKKYINKTIFSPGKKIKEKLLKKCYQNYKNEKKNLK